MRPAVVISAHTTGLAVIRALGERGVPVYALCYDPADIGCASKYVKRAIAVPHPETDEEGFLEVLRDRAAELAGGLLIPCSDAALSILASHKQELEAGGYTVACPELPITRRFLDKKYTYALAGAVGVPAPRTFVLRSMDDLEEHLPAFDYPCLLKPSQGHRYFDIFKEKMVYAANFQELVAAYQRAALHGIEMMLQEHIPGDDSCGVNYNCYFWNGQPLVEFTAQKIQNAPPRLGSPCVVQSKPIPEVIEAGRRLLRAGGFQGFACTEFKRDPRDGVYKLMEVNGRHNLSGLLAIRCGINFPWLHYQHLVRGILPEPQDFAAGVYWIDPLRHWGRCLRHFSSSFTLSGFFKPYFGSPVLADLDWNDLGPFRKRLGHALSKGM